MFCVLSVFCFRFISYSASSFLLSCLFSYFYFFNTLVLNLTFTGMLKVSADEFEEETARDEVTPT